MRKTRKAANSNIYCYHFSFPCPDIIMLRTAMKYKYHKVDKSIINELISIAGSNNVYLDESELERYSIDESTMAVSRFPEIIVKAPNTKITAQILNLANKKKIPVTPRGAGTGVSGGCIPLYGGIVLSLEKMNHIKRIDVNNFIAIVEPGVSLEQLNEELHKHNLYYPIHIGDMSATIGGNIATNAGGMNAIKYGVTRNHVLGLEAVLPSGKIIHTGGEFIKCTTGYDFTQLLVGSEGTLAVITGITLKLLPRPSFREIMFIPFDNLQNAIDTVPELLKLKTVPTGIEFMDNDTVKIIEKHMKTEVPYHEHEAFLMIIMEGDSYEDIIGCFSDIEKICRDHGAIEVLASNDERAKRKLIDIREKIQPAIKRAGKSDLVDAVVPRSEIARFVSKVKELSKEYGIPIITFGHAGDGNVHLHPICSGIEEKEWLKKMPFLMEKIYNASVSLGGTISGEHGIGLEKKKYLPIAMDSDRIELMKEIKLIFDPNNILNPGKIFDL
jgi:glycolate oxidase